MASRAEATAAAIRGAFWYEHPRRFVMPLFKIPLIDAMNPSLVPISSSVFASSLHFTINDLRFADKFLILLKGPPAGRAYSRCERQCHDGNNTRGQVYEQLPAAARPHSVRVGRSAPRLFPPAVIAEAASYPCNERVANRLPKYRTDKAEHDFEENLIDRARSHTTKRT